jgi:type I thyroxine 5'-deiodinase
MDANEKGKDDVCYLQPRTLADRVNIANDFVKRFHYPLPMVVDAMDNKAGELYAAWPERLYIINPDGRIAYRGGMGPFDYHPEQVRAFLEKKN